MTTANNLSKLTLLTAVTDLSRVLISTTDNSFVTIGNTSTHSLSLNGNLVTYKDFFSKTYQIKTKTNGDASTGFRIDSELHCIYSLDNSGNTLLFRENWGQNTDSSCGYINFTYTGGNLIAKERYVYDTSYHKLDSAFTYGNNYIQTNNGNLTLTSSQSSASAYKIYASPFDVSIPYDFNPGSISYQSNDRVSIVDYISNSISDMESKVAQDMKSTYTSQISATGSNSSTNSAAEAMLSAIQSTLSANEESLRYDTSVYSAFRNGLLSYVNNTDSIANGTLGQNSNPYVYFTNETDDAGNYHPFMCIASYSITDRPNHLLDVPRPPGDGNGGYGSSKVTRDATLQQYLFKIPMKDYGVVSNITDNSMGTTLRDDYISDVSAGYSIAENCYNYASKSGLGVTIDGLVMYPIMNNNVVPAQSVAEITSSGFHVGRGMGLHYHADGHGAHDTSFNLYNTHDYHDHKHPPLVGFGFDGIALYGRYEDDHSDMHGYGTALDTYGGHEHGNYGYHYHCHSVSIKNGVDQDTSETLFEEDSSNWNVNDNTNVQYTLHLLMKGAWKGQINDVPRFWANDSGTDNNGETGSPSYSLSQKHKYVGKTT